VLFYNIFYFCGGFSGDNKNIWNNCSFFVGMGYFFTNITPDLRFVGGERREVTVFCNTASKEQVFLSGRIDTAVPKRIITVTILYKITFTIAAPILADADVFRKLHMLITNKVRSCCRLLLRLFQENGYLEEHL